AAGDDFLFGGTPFALEETARNLARGVVVFAIVHGQGEEVDPLARIVRTRGGQDHCVSEADIGRSVGLLGKLAAFDRQGAVTQGYADLLLHFFLLRTRVARSTSGLGIPGIPVGVARLAVTTADPKAAR